MKFYDVTWRCWLCVQTKDAETALKRSGDGIWQSRWQIRLESEANNPATIDLKTNQINGLLKRSAMDEGNDKSFNNSCDFDWLRGWYLTERRNSEVWPKPIPASNLQKYQPLAFARQYLFPALISALEKISHAISLDDFGHHSYCYEECSPIFWKAEICRGSQYVQPVTIRTSAIFWIFAKKTSWLTRIRLSSSREGEAPICVESGSWTP